MKDAAEATKIAKETGWSTIACALADATREGNTATAAYLIDHLREMRLIEQQGSDYNSSMAALGRQIGDAAQKGRDTAPMIAALVKVRNRQLTGHE